MHHFPRYTSIKVSAALLGLKPTHLEPKCGLMGVSVSMPGLCWTGSYQVCLAFALRPIHVAQNKYFAHWFGSGRLLDEGLNQMSKGEGGTRGGGKHMDVG